MKAFLDHYWADIKVLLVTSLGYAGMFTEHILLFINPDIVAGMDMITESLTKLVMLFSAIFVFIYGFFRAKIEYKKYKSFDNDKSRKDYFDSKE